MTGSPSASARVAVAVSVWLVVGPAGLSPTVAVGAELATVAGEDVTGLLESRPSDAVARTRIWSPRSPLPAVARLSVEAVAPAMSTPFFVHW